jgi:hypothetical protein
VNKSGELSPAEQEMYARWAERAEADDYEPAPDAIVETRSGTTLEFDELERALGIERNAGGSKQPNPE